MKRNLVIDIGGSFIKFVLMENFEIKERGKIKTPEDTLDNLLEELDKISKKFEDYQGIAICMPGIIDSKKGFAYHGGALTYIKNVEIKKLIEEKTGRKVSIENDGKSAALGEFWKGALKGIDNGVAIVIGTGIGGGIILDGKLINGAHFGAGEFSLIRVNRYDDKDKEQIFTMQGSSLALVKNVAKSKNIPIEHMSGEKVFDLLNNNDKITTNIFNRFCDDISTQIWSLQSILDPEKFVIGGGISIQPKLIQGLNESLTRTKIDIGADNPLVEKSMLGNDANIYGALYNYLQKYEKC